MTLLAARVLRPGSLYAPASAGDGAYRRLTERDVLGLDRDLRRPVAVAALVDRLVHHAEIITLKGDSYRLKGKKNAGIVTMPAD